jgi:hypothetical protein
VDWSVPAPDGPTPDRYWCAAVTIDRDMLLSGFRAIYPPVTHHLVASVGAPTRADGQFECDFTQNHSALLFAAGVGTDDFNFPDGVALPVMAGQQLVVNAPLFNTTDKTLTGTSGVAARAVDSADIEAEFTFAGTLAISIPDGSTAYPISGSCTMPADATILNWWPHMHKLGRRMTVELNGTAVQDEDFTFTEQINYPTNRQVSAGDQLDVTCYYDNHTGGTVTFGDSSNEEMCFVGFYRYPKAGIDFCGNGF